MLYRCTTTLYIVHMYVQVYIVIAYVHLYRVVHHMMCYTHAMCTQTHTSVSMHWMYLHTSTVYSRVLVWVLMMGVAFMEYVLP